MLPETTLGIDRLDTSWFFELLQNFSEQRGAQPGHSSVRAVLRHCVPPKGLHPLDLRLSLHAWISSKLLFYCFTTAAEFLALDFITHNRAAEEHANIHHRHTQRNSKFSSKKLLSRKQSKIRFNKMRCWLLSMRIIWT